jgi:hypothetical protein
VIYRLDRLLGMIILADLSGGEVDQDLLESVAQSVVDRGAEVLNGDAPNVSPRALRLDLTNADAVSLEEAYEVVDGALIDLYNEDDPLRQAREATYSGTTDAYSSAVVAANGVQAGDEQTATEETGGTTVAYGSTVLAFPSPEDAEEWLSGLADRLSEDPLRGYLSFAAVSDPPVFGEGSAVYAFQRQIDDEVASGYRVYVRVGPMSRGRVCHGRGSVLGRSRRAGPRPRWPASKPTLAELRPRYPAPVRDKARIKINRLTKPRLRTTAGRSAGKAATPRARQRPKTRV